MGRDSSNVGAGDAGGELSIAELYDSHAAPLLRWFQSRTFSSEAAADLCAETFATAIESQDRFDPQRGAPGAWLWGIARNLLRQYHRTSEVERRARIRLGITTPSVTDDDLDRVDDLIDAGPLAAALAVQLDDLPPGRAAAVRARVVDGLSYAAVAEICGCSVGAARVRVSRGLVELLGLVERDEDDSEVTP